MPSVTHDGRSFMVDGRRVWLVSARVPYALLPRESWAQRIHLAKQAGCNTIETPIIWNRHETRPGRFDFTGDNDLRHFIDLAGKQGMYVILGIGPYVGGEWDFGGLPAYLRESSPGPDLRRNNQQFMEACSRFISAVSDQIRGWQVTAPGTGGPIILLQCESEWTCGHESLAASYLGELTRYIHEAGLSVPIINSNNLWASVEGQIDGWAGSTDMLATMRQLSAVRNEQPKVVMDFACAEPETWGAEAGESLSARQVQQRLAEVLAGGGQFNLTTFCGGTRFGFSGGRTDAGTATFVTHAAEHGCMLTQSGQRTELYFAARRIAMFASRFSRLFGALDPAFQPVAVRPGHGATTSGRSKAKAQAGSVSVVHAHGQQGGAAFLFAPMDDAPSADRSTTLLLRDGTELPVAMGSMPVVACLLDVNVSPRCHVDYCGASALGTTGSLLVVYGPASARVHLSVNGSPVEATLPGSAKPSVLQHEGLTLVLVRDEDVDHVVLQDDCVLTGVTEVGADGSVLSLPEGAKHYQRITHDGAIKQVAFEPVKKKSPAKGGKLALEEWLTASADSYADGSNARYANIASFQELAALGCPSGYGWYRLKIDADRAGSRTLDFGRGGDRLHVYQGGKFLGIAGVGPGADAQLDVTLHKGEQTFVVLVENLGRFAEGISLGDRKGIVGDAYFVEPVRAGKPVHEMGSPLPLLAFRAPLWDVGEGETTVADRLTWTFKGKPEGPTMVRIGKPPHAGLLLLNDKPFAYVDRSGPACIMIPDELLSRGTNRLQMTVVTPEQAEEDLAVAGESLKVFHAPECISDIADAAFAKWEAPHAGAYETLRPASIKGGLPRWFRATFELNAPVAGVFFSPVGMTKGQFYVNGKHVGRYFVATRSGKNVPPQEAYFIPGAWLKTEGVNELTVFDEHGALPSKAKLTIS